jgi:Ca2+-binding RTX toxin-like protein
MRGAAGDVVEKQEDKTITHHRRLVARCDRTSSFVAIGRLYRGSRYVFALEQRDGGRRSPPQGIEDELFDGSGEDELVGNAGNDRLFDHAGADALNGGSGDDRLTCGGGRDALLGQAGRDTYFARGDGAADSIGSVDGEDSLDGDAFQVTI